MSILNVDKIQPIGSGSTVTVNATDTILTNAQAGVITATRFDGIISATTDDWITHQGDSNTRMGFPDTDTFKVETAGNQRLHITSAGKVGIGIDPTARLHVNGLSSDTAIILARAADSNGNSIINILSEGTTGSSRIVFSDTAAATGDAWISYGHSRRELTFTTAGTSNNRLTLDSSGRCLIGVASSMLTSPRLQVYQASSSSGAQILIRGDGNSFCEASILGQVNASTRGSGFYAHDRANNNEWFWGRPYSGNDQFIIARKASPSVPGQDTAQSSNSIMKVFPNGNVTINDGDLIMGTSGHGIDFSANTNDATGLSDETLDDYEEGVYIPSIVGSSGGSWTTATYRHMAYTKIGRMVQIQGYLQCDSESSPSGSLRIQLPFTVGSLSGDAENGAITVSMRGHGNTSTMYNVCGAVSSNYLEIISVAGNGTHNWVDQSDVGTSWNIRIGGCYTAT